MRNPFLITEPTVISFSGGRTSAYMLWRVLQANGGLPKESIVCFANTGKEEEATLEFVRDCEKNWGVEIHWLEFRDADPAFERVTFKTASRSGEPFEALIRKRKYLPNPVNRFCTSGLKIRTIANYLFEIGFTEKKSYGEDIAWIGIRADEGRRAAKIADKSRVPLYSAGVTKHTIEEFWQQQPFDLNLPIINGETIGGNCDLCFLKSLPKISSLVAQKPERATWWAKMESLKEIPNTGGNGNRFRIDRPKYADIHKFIDRQGNMFEDSIECFCGD